MSEIPSEVNDRQYMRVPNQDKVIEDDDEWNRCGMWILTNNYGGMSWIDETWIKLQVLLEKGFLIMIKASTAAMARNNPNDVGTILCFTRPGEEEIERAAKEIRKTVHYELPLYYKINYMTQNKIDHRNGHRRISHYMHTFMGFFYRNCPAEGWILVNGTDFEKQQEKSFSRELWNFENFVDRDLDQLLSRSSDVYRESKDLRLPTRSCFTVYCSLKEVDNCLSEADRLWIIGKKLIDEGVVDRITCLKSSNIAKFKFLFLNKLEDESIVKLCNKIQEEAQVFRFIYIFSENIYYRYSPEKELDYLPNNYKTHKAPTSRKKKRNLHSEYVILD